MEISEEEKDLMFLVDLQNKIKKRPQLAGKAILAVSDGMTEASRLLQGKINFIDLTLAIRSEKTLHEMFSEMNPESLKEYGLTKYTKK